MATYYLEKYKCGGVYAISFLSHTKCFRIHTFSETLKEWDILGEVGHSVGSGPASNPIPVTPKHSYKN